MCSIDSFITWIGGKKLLRKTIVAQFPKEGIEKYVEVFGGAAWVLFAKEKHAPKEVYNDIMRKALVSIHFLLFA